MGGEGAPLATWRFYSEKLRPPELLREAYLLQFQKRPLRKNKPLFSLSLWVRFLNMGQWRNRVKAANLA